MTQDVLKNINLICTSLLFTLVLITACSKSPQKVELVEAPTIPPEWAKEAVWYQIYIDSFYNGNSLNDPNGSPINAFDAKVAFRRYGGDFQGVMNKLDYLSNLGINAILIDPFNHGQVTHKFDSIKWQHVDVYFGPDPVADSMIIEDEVPDEPSSWVFTAADRLFLDFLQQAKSKGIRVILDFSWRQLGDANQSNSLEENLLTEQAKSHLFSVTRRWLDPNGDGDPSDGVDGYRLTKHSEIPRAFLKEYRTYVKSINSEALLVEDRGWEKRPDDLINPAPVLQGDMYDSVINYRWFRAARQYFATAPNSSSASEFVESLQAQRQGFGSDFYQSMLNITASQETPRLLTSLNNNNKFIHNAKTSRDPGYLSDKPSEDATHNVKLFLAHQFSYLGAPQIWAGDEMGMWGSNIPHNKKPLIWPEFTFENETTHPQALNKTINSVAFNEELFQFYQFMIKLRREFSVLSKGDIDFTNVNDGRRLFGYRRFFKSDIDALKLNDEIENQQQAWIIFNTSEYEHTVLSPEPLLNASFWSVWQSNTKLSLLTTAPSEQLLLPANTVIIVFTH